MREKDRGQEKKMPAEIALWALQRCCHDGLIGACSPDGHFNNGVWQRDAIDGGVSGLLAVGNADDVGRVEKTLDYFLSFHPPFPYRTLSQKMLLNYLGLNSPLPRTRAERHVPFAKRLINGQLMTLDRPLVADSFLVLGGAGAFLGSKRVPTKQKWSFWEKHRGNIKRGVDFYKPESGLITEAPLASRQDVILKSGAVGLTNILWFLTLKDLGLGARRFDPSWAETIELESLKARVIFNQAFWLSDTDHYLDWIDTDGKQHRHFDSLANFWAIVAGLADERQALKILATADDLELVGSNGLTEAVFPPYKKCLIERGNQLIGMDGYYNHGEVYWPEITIMHAAALGAVGLMEESRQLMDRVDKLLLWDGTLYETYDREGRPLERNLFLGWKYRAPADFTKALGTYLWVQDELSRR